MRGYNDHVVTMITWLREIYLHFFTCCKRDPLYVALLGIEICMIILGDGGHRGMGYITLIVMMSFGKEC